MSAEGKRIRKRKRAQKKGFSARDEEKEDEVYASGLFSLKSKEKHTEIYYKYYYLLLLNFIMH